MSSERQHVPDARVLVSSGIHKEVRREKHENIRFSNSCLNRMMATCVT